MLLCSHIPVCPWASVCLLCRRERQVCVMCVCRRAGRWKVGEKNLKLATKCEIQYNIQDSLWGFLYQISKKMSWQTFLKVNKIMSIVRKLKEVWLQITSHIIYIWSCNHSFCFCLISWKLPLITLSQVEDLTPNIGRAATPCRGTRGWGSRAGLHGHGTGCHLEMETLFKADLGEISLYWEGGLLQSPAQS